MGRSARQNGNMNILIDTSIIIDHLRRSDKINSYLTSLSNKYSEHNISIITYSELWSGKGVWESKNKYQEISLLCKSVNIIPCNQALAKSAGKIRSFNTISLPDAIIAATAIKHKLSLATLNTKDFSPIPHLKLAKLSQSPQPHPPQTE